MIRAREGTALPGAFVAERAVQHGDGFASLTQLTVPFFMDYFVPTIDLILQLERTAFSEPEPETVNAGLLAIIR